MNLHENFKVAARVGLARNREGARARQPRGALIAHLDVRLRLREPERRAGRQREAQPQHLELGARPRHDLALEQKEGREAHAAAQGRGHGFRSCNATAGGPPSGGLGIKYRLEICFVDFVFARLRANLKPLTLPPLSHLVSRSSLSFLRPVPAHE